MRKLGAMVLIAAGVLVSSAASAQSWGVYVGNAPRYQGYDRQDDDWNNGFRAVCSGQRARSLEAKLRHESGEDEIDDWDAARIHRQIDRLERKQDRECREGDWRAIRKISYQYDQLDQWIDQQAHGRWGGD